MGNVLSDEKKQQVLALGRLGWPLRRIEAETGVRRETASAYLRAAGVAVRPPRQWGHAKPAKETIPDPGGGAEAKPAKEVIPDSGWPRPSRSPAASACEVHRDLIEEWLGRGRNAKAIYQDLVVDHGFTARYASVSRYVRKLHGTRAVDAHPVIETAPGEEAQVDYGEGPMVRDATTGKYRRTRLFVLTLGCSRKSVRLLTWRSSARTWCELHELAFRRLGGAPRVLVLDNLKEGVLTPDVYDPAVNPLYRDVLKHYGAVALPCRVRHPDRKGKVGVGDRAHAGDGAEGAALREHRGRAAAPRPLGRALGGHAHPRDDEAPGRGDVCRGEAAPLASARRAVSLLPVWHADGAPRRPRRDRRRVLLGSTGHHRTCAVGAVGRAPRASAEHDDRRAAARARSCSSAGVTARTKRTSRRRRRRRLTSCSLGHAVPGSNIGVVAAEIHHRDGEVGVRRIVGLLGMVKKHGHYAVDAACSMALGVGVPTYRFVRQYVERETGPRAALKQIDPLIRDLTHYRDLIANITKEPA